MTRRGSFGPVVLLGLTSAALAAFAGNKPWTEVHEPGGECAIYPPAGVRWSDFAVGAPLAGALGLVILAAWGVLLVTRGRVRRAMAVVAMLASGGFLATAVWARGALKDDSLAKAARRVGEMPEGCLAASVWMNNTWWLAALAVGLIGIVAAVLAVLLAPHWPEMGSKYDAPTGTAATLPPTEEWTSTDLWKSLDAGHDPTVE